MVSLLDCAVHSQLVFNPTTIKQKRKNTTTTKAHSRSPGPHSGFLAYQREFIFVSLFHCCFCCSTLGLDGPLDILAAEITIYRKLMWQMVRVSSLNMLRGPPQQQTDPFSMAENTVYVVYKQYLGTRLHIVHFRSCFSFLFFVLVFLFTRYSFSRVPRATGIFYRTPRA